MSEAKVASQLADEALEKVIIVEPDIWVRQWWLLRCACQAAHQDNCFGIAKGVAYSSLLSLFPLLTTLTAVLFQLKAQSVLHVIGRFAQEILPPGTEDLVLSRLHQRAGHPVSLPLVATVLSLWAGSGAMASLMEGFQAAFRTPQGRSFLRQRAVAVLLVLIAALPAVAASSLVIFGNHIEAALIHWVGVDEISTPVRALWKLLRYGVAFAAVTLGTGLLYYFGPNDRPEPPQVLIKLGSRFRRVWPGALLATILWLLATGAFAGYVSHVADYNIFYGSLATVVILLVWLYLLACITLLGCEYNAERERLASLSTF